MAQQLEQYSGDLKPFFDDLGVSSLDELPSVPVAGEILKSESSPREKVERVAPSNSMADELIKGFKGHLEGLSIQLDEAVIVDLLASYMSSQFLLFAGPSGTGKSTVARALQSFFAPKDSRLLIYAKRQLLGPEDLSGYYSPITNQFIVGPETAGLYKVGSYAPEFASPSVLVEEINLSPPEGYLNPFIHGISSLSCPILTWQLFPDELEESGLGKPKVEIGPFPRIMGTINVDASAPPPAPKVAARACVILMEPQIVTELDQVVAALKSEQNSDNSKYSGSQFVGDPLAVMQCEDLNIDGIKQECLRLAAALEQGEEPFSSDWDPVTSPIKGISRRQLSQVIVYSAWFSLLAKAVEPASTSLHPRIAAENAVLHHLLPSLDASGFSDALEKLFSAKGALTTRSKNQLGGLLSERVTRLEMGGEAEGYAGRLLDYWDRLS